MKRWFVPILMLGAVLTVALAQSGVRVVTHPRIPTPDVLDRLGLAFSWHTRLPLDGPLDSIASIQVLPRGTGELQRTEVLVQTLAGFAHLFDGETGALRWRTKVGINYIGTQSAAANDQSIILSRREFFFVLNRDTGIQRVYKKAGGEKIFGIRLDSVPTAGPMANGDIVVFPFRDRAIAYAIPDFDRIAQSREKEPEIIAQEKEGSIQPLFFWSFFDPTLKLSSTPIVTATRVGLAAEDGRVQSVLRREGTLRFEYKFAGPVSPPGYHGDIAYLGSQDFFVYALDLDREQLLWRFPSGVPILTRPEVNDVDVFVRAEGRGLFRLDRTYGQNYWLAPGAERFVSAHYARDRQGKYRTDKQGRVLAKYVYALDRHGQLQVLDGDRGMTLAHYDTRAWSIPVSNEWTDRLYFANSDGQILCLHPRESRIPQRTKTILPPRKELKDSPRAVAPDEPKKDEEKKADDKVGLLTPQSPHREASLIEPLHVTIARSALQTGSLRTHRMSLDPVA